MSAVICRERGSCAIEDIPLAAPRPREVVIRMDASGICHSDVAVMTGELPGVLPCVLGHEGAGVVVDVGADVTTVRLGDRVVLSAIPACGTCYFCSRGQPYVCSRAEHVRSSGFLDGNERVRGASGLGTFSDALVVPEPVVIPVRSDLPAEQLALIGCAVLTGAGTAVNLAEIDPGDSLMVIGAGGIGLCAIQGARLQSALPLIAVDPAETSRRLAEACGATHTFDPADPGLVERVRELTGGIGVDTVIDCVGSASTFELAWTASRRAGTIVEVGVPGRDVAVPIPLVDITLSGKRLIGCVYGGTSVHRDVPRWVALAEAGRFDLSILIGRRIGLADVPAALLGPLGPGRTVIVP